MNIKSILDLTKDIREHPKDIFIIGLILVVICLFPIIRNQIIKGIDNVVNDKEKLEKIEKTKQEQYVVDITPEIMHTLQNIMSHDFSASNILLMNYHNTLISSNGLPYKYLTTIREEIGPGGDGSVINAWKELDYMNYGEEIIKINNSKFLFFNDINRMQTSLPKFYFLVRQGNFKSAAFFPIVGVNSYVGILVILYKDEKDEITTEYLQKTVFADIQRLSTLLDYDYYKSIKK